MTKKNLIYLLVFAFGFAFVACDKDKDNDKESDIGVSVNTISAKWVISDSKSSYSSFEFNKDGNYIVVENVEANLRNSSVISKAALFKNNGFKAAAKTRSSESESNLSPIHFGTYKIEGNKIILSGFGLIEVISLTAEEFSFSFTLESTGEKNSFVAGKSDEPISTSSRTEMLCRTWVGDKVTIDVSKLSEEDIYYFVQEYGENWKVQVEKEATDDFKGLIALFSRAGTYLVLYKGEDGEAGLSEWKWANTQETKIYYSWENWTDEWEENIVTVTNLTSNTLAFEEWGYIYHMVLKK
jgi:hypothetical protein